jgi:hypothetical protein
MMMDAVLAIALGVVPVPAGAPAVKVHVSADQRVTGYSQRVDRSGTIHLKGIQPGTGVRYYFTVKKSGKVKGWAGSRMVSFQAAPAS